MKKIARKIAIIFLIFCFRYDLPVTAKIIMNSTKEFHKTPLQASISKDVPPGSAESYAVSGDKILNYYENLSIKEDSERFLIAAKYFYYQANRVDVSNQNALIGMARIALFQNNIREAKDNLYKALNFNEYSSKINFYLGETFFQDGEFTDAIKYYKRAYVNGYKTNYKTNLKLGICYEKLDDPAQAKSYYTAAINLMPSLSEPKHRLQGLYTIKVDYETYERQFREREERLNQFDPDDLNLEGLPQEL